MKQFDVLGTLCHLKLFAKNANHSRSVSLKINWYSLFLAFHLCLLFVVFSCLPLGAQNTRVVSFNIRLNTPVDKENCWDNRREEVVGMIRYYQPDILGIEEGLYEQVDYMHQSLTAYSYVGVGRDGGNNGEFSAIFYKHQNLTVLETETYWLSETPRIPSKGWDADYNRVVTFACFRHNTTHDTLYVFNTHWDHIGEIARKNSADYLLSLIEEKGLSAKMVVVMGDFNGEPQDAPIVVMKSALNDAYDISQTPPYGPVGTFNGFDANMQANRRIDYVFVKNMTVANYRTIDDRRNNYLFLSDHFPVLVELAKPH